MTKAEFDFETWFDSLSMMVLDETGVEFRDVESVRDDYDNGRNLADVAREIADEIARLQSQPAEQGAEPEPSAHDLFDGSDHNLIPPDDDACCGDDACVCAK